MGANQNFHGTHYWWYLNGNAAIINLPTSYPPPDEFDGAHVVGGAGAEQSGFTTSPEREAEFRDTHGYTVHPQHLGDLSVEDPDGPCVEEIYDLIDVQFDVLEECVASGDYEFVHLTVFYINVFHHFFWDHEVIRKAWKRINERIADLLALDEHDTLFVMSDHR